MAYRSMAYQTIGVASVRATVRPSSTSTPNKQTFDLNHQDLEERWVPSVSVLFKT